MELSAADVYQAGAANMPGAWAGRWERWAPPKGAAGEGVVKPDDPASGWQLLTSGGSRLDYFA